MEDEDALVGKTLSRRYRLLSRFGRRGISPVYLAEDKRGRREVIVKKACKGRDAAADLRRLQVEALTLKFVRHPRVVELLDWDVDRKAGEFIVLERLTGGTLDRILDGGPRLSPAFATGIIRETLEGLEAVHAAGFLHRDIKPTNLIVSDRGIKIIDFNMAIPRSGLTSGSTWKRITDPWCTVGTPDYMAPELCQGAQAIDVQVDLYAVGILFYELLVGRPPFDAESSQDVMLMQQTCDPPAFPDPVREQVPAGLEAFVMRALEKRPKDRFATAASMREILLSIPP